MHDALGVSKINVKDEREAEKHEKQQNERMIPHIFLFESKYFYFSITIEAHQDQWTAFSHIFGN